MYFLWLLARYTLLINLVCSLHEMRVAMETSNTYYAYIVLIMLTNNKDTETLFDACLHKILVSTNKYPL